MKQRIKKQISVITDTDRLADLCRLMRQEPFVCLDTEFLRESTFWPVLCLLQIGSSCAGSGDAHVIDPLAEHIDLSPFYELLTDAGVTKVVHAGSQDVEIFLHRIGVVPTPIFDTQVAASVCGFSDQISYGALVRQLVGVRIDKSLQRTDWSLRPLGDRQLEYALGDVIYLPSIYRKLKAWLAELDRNEWITEKLEVLCDPASYNSDPREAWRRLKTNSKDRMFLAVLRELAAWRECEARRQDVPRMHVVSDAILQEIAALRPESCHELSSLQAVRRKNRHMKAKGKEHRMKELQAGILAAVRRGLDCSPQDCPKPVTRRSPNQEQSVKIMFLKLLLRSLAASAGVAPELIAGKEDLERLAMEESPDIRLLFGWRRKEFGEELLRLNRGEIALTFCGGRIISIPVMYPGSVSAGSVSDGA